MRPLRDDYVLGISASEVTMVIPRSGFLALGVGVWLENEFGPFFFVLQCSLAFPTSPRGWHSKSYGFHRIKHCKKWTSIHYKLSILNVFCFCNTTTIYLFLIFPYLSGHWRQKILIRYVDDNEWNKNSWVNFVQLLVKLTCLLMYELHNTNLIILLILYLN